jgi:alkylated DNA nucleotide flippase Atl1
LWNDVGKVAGLWSRRTPEMLPDSCKLLELLANCGIVGDCHLDSFSPRQVLIASEYTYAHFNLPPGSLRENITLSGPIGGVPPGSIIAIGREVRLRAMFRCEPCAKLNEKQSGLMRGIGSQRGVLARVIGAGRIRVGDIVRVSEGAAVPMADSWEARLKAVVSAVPRGCVIEYAQLARVIGVPITYCRVFPRIIGSLPSDLRARAVPAANRCGTPRWSGATYYSDADDELPHSTSPTAVPLGVTPF